MSAGVVEYDVERILAWLVRDGAGFDRDTQAGKRGLVQKCYFPCLDPTQERPNGTNKIPIVRIKPAVNYSGPILVMNRDMSAINMASCRFQELDPRYAFDQ